MKLQRLLLALLIALTLYAPTVAPAAAPAQLQALQKELVDGEWSFPDTELLPHANDQPTAQLDARPLPDGPASAAVPGWQDLVFASGRTGNWEIMRYKYANQTTTMLNLTQHSAQDIYPRLSPDVKKIVFVSDRDGNLELYRMNLDGSNLVRLTNSAVAETQPVWSPDGRHIAFVSFRDGNWDIYSMLADGTQQKRLTSNAAPEAMPAWSPDGSTIAWVRATGNQGVIWLMAADGSHERAITAPHTYLEHPVWSPDGTQIAVDYDANQNGFNDLGIMNADGTNLQQLPTANGNRDLMVSGWSPNGQHLVLWVRLYTGKAPNLTLSNQYVGRIQLDPLSMSPPISALWDGMPDLRSRDISAPITTMAPLEPLLRAGEVEIRWTTKDPGPAPMDSYDLQYRVGSGPWVDWYLKTTVSHVFTGVAGQHVAFRVRGRDAGGNVEAWRTSEEGDAHTSFYSWRLAGALTDSRGTLLPGATTILTPTPMLSTPTNAAGAYAAWLSSSGAHQLVADKPGYAKLPPTSLIVTQDQTFDAYLGPLDDVVANGDFEASASELSGWDVTGLLPSGVTTTTYRTGTAAASLGRFCPVPCFTTPEVVPMATGSSSDDRPPFDMVVDGTGTLHALTDAGGAIYYVTRGVTGTWSASQQIGQGSRPQIAIDAQQTIHTLWLSPTNGLLYRQLPSGGSWSSEEALGPAWRSTLLIDSQGQPHVFYNCLGVAGCPNAYASYYRARKQGAWQAASELPSGALAAAIDPNDVIRLFLNAASGYPGTVTPGSFIAHILPDGTLSPMVKVGPPTPQVEENSKALMVLDEDGNRHVFYTNRYSVGYTMITPQGTQSAWELVAQWGQPANQAIDIVLDQQETIWLINSSAWVDSGIYLRRKERNSPWSPPVQIRPGNGDEHGVIAVDMDDGLHIMRSGAGCGQEVCYEQTEPGQPALSVSLAQSVSIPADSLSPTLAFDYRLTGVSPTNGSWLELSATTGVTSVTVLSQTLSGGWGHAWVDMSAWQGQTISMTFTLYQAPEAPPAHLLLDHISLGSWAPAQSWRKQFIPLLTSS